MVVTKNKNTVRPLWQKAIAFLIFAVAIIGIVALIWQALFGAPSPELYTLRLNEYRSCEVEVIEIDTSSLLDGEWVSADLVGGADCPQNVVRLTGTNDDPPLGVVALSNADVSLYSRKNSSPNATGYTPVEEGIVSTMRVGTGDVVGENPVFAYYWLKSITSDSANLTLYFIAFEYPMYKVINGETIVYDTGADPLEMLCLFTTEGHQPEVCD